MNTDADAAERETRAHSSASPEAQQKNKIPLVENERGVCKGKLLAGLMNSETESARLLTQLIARQRRRRQCRD